MKNKTKVYLLSVISLILVSGVVGFNVINSRLHDLGSLHSNTTDVVVLADGTCYGSAQVFPIKVEVNVQVKDHTIENIQVLQHVNSLGKEAEVIIDKVIYSQRLDGDVICGAT